MEPNFRPPLNSISFTEKTRIAAYMLPEYRSTPQQFFVNHPYHESLRCPRPFENETIQREIEKERIREEIIISEISRRRTLEAEAMRELMMERELALKVGADRFPYMPQQMVFEHLNRHSLVGTTTVAMFPERRVEILGEQTPIRRLEIGGSDTILFQRGTPELSISDVRNVSEGKEEQRIGFLAKSDEKVSGLKRIACELESDNILKKKAKEEWSCALCQVSTTSEQGLNAHLQGKKHKSNETAMRSQKGGKSYSIGLANTNISKPVPVVGTVNPGIEGAAVTAAPSVNSKSQNTDYSNREKKESRLWCNICNIGTTSESTMNIHLKGKKHLKKKQERIGKTGCSGNLKPKNVIEYRCELCDVATTTLKVMNNHKKGKKHLRQLEKSGENSGSCTSKIAAVEKQTECVTEEDEKIALENVDNTMDKQSLVNDDPVQ